MASDEELLTAWRDGDRDAGDALFSRHFAAICRFFRSKLGDDVEDLIQRTFLDCLAARDAIAGTSFRGFLFAVARNRLFDHLRRTHGAIADLGSRSLTDLGSRPSERFARAEARHWVAQAMATIPLDFRIALELAYWEGLDGPEIAAALEIPANTVRSRLARGRAALRDALRDLGVDVAELVAGPTPPGPSPGSEENRDHSRGLARLLGHADVDRPVDAALLHADERDRVR